MTDIAKEVREADAQAERACLAFLLGKFEEYWEAEYGRVIQRLNTRYDELDAAATSKPNG